MVTRTTLWLTDDGVKMTERKYLRYWKNSSSGPDHGVMLVLDYEGARRFDWTDSSFDNDFLSAATNDLKPYASAYLEYDSSRRVRTVQRSVRLQWRRRQRTPHDRLRTDPSLSATSGYDTAWHHRAVIGRPDGSYVTQYFDEMGQALSTVVSSLDPAGATTPTHWATRVIRDSNGYVTEVWTPDSVSGYTHNTSGSPTGSFTADSSGLSISTRASAAARPRDISRTKSGATSRRRTSSSSCAA